MKNFKAHKIIVTIIFAIVTVLSSIMLVDIISKGNGLGTAFGFIVWLILAIIGFSASMIVSLIGTITSAIKRKQGLCDTKTLIYFIVFTALPIMVFSVSIVLFNILV